MSPPRLARRNQAPVPPKVLLQRLSAPRLRGAGPRAFQLAASPGLLEEGWKRISEGIKVTGLGSQTGHAVIPVVKWEIGEMQNAPGDKCPYGEHAHRLQHASCTGPHLPPLPAQAERVWKFIKSFPIPYKFASTFQPRAIHPLQPPGLHPAQPWKFLGMGTAQPGPLPVLAGGKKKLLSPFKLCQAAT